MKHRLLILTILVIANLKAFGFGYSYQGKTLYYTIIDESQHYVSLINPYIAVTAPFSGNYYNYVTGDVVVPSHVTYGGISYTVKAIGSNTFKGCSGITSIVIPDGIDSIGNWAFWNCSGLSSVSIPDGVVSIGSGAFRDCSGLNSIVIPNTVTYIGSQAFYGCTELTTLTLSTGLISIEPESFGGCNNLSSVVIPNSVTSIGNSAFYWCNSLSSVIIPNSVTSIGKNAFYNCNGLESVIIPDNVTSIGQSAFSGCSLDSLTIGSGLISLGNNAFLGDTVIYLSYNCNINIPANIRKDRLHTVVIGDNVSSVGDEAFYNVTTLSSIHLGNNISSIGNQAFYNCFNLDSIQIPNSVTQIGGSVFMNCTGLTSILIPDAVATIGQSAFMGCNNLEFVTLGNSISSIGSQAFFGCSSLTAITIPDGITSIESRTFYGCNNLEYISIPNSVTSIGMYAFCDCNNLDTVYMMPTTAPSLNTSVFGGNAQNRVFVLNGCSYDNYYTASSWNGYRNALRDPEYNFNLNLSANDTVRGNVNVIGLRNRTIRCDSTAIIQAIPYYGYHFSSWNDGDTNNPRSIKVTCDTSLTAQFVPNTYNIFVFADTLYGVGSVSGSVTAQYLDSVTISATPSYGYHFSHWSDYDTNNPKVVSVTGNASYIAYFYPNTYNVSVGVDDSIHGWTNGGGCRNYLSNSTIEAHPYYGYHFDRWDDGDTNNPRTITLTKDTTFTAQFAKNQYTVRVVSMDSTRGNVSGGATVDYLDSVTLMATANHGYHFSHWDGDAITGTSHLMPLSLVVTQDMTLRAYFASNQYLLTVQSASDSNWGSISGGGNYDYLSSHTIMAHANYGYHFDRWDDGDTNNPRTITLTQDTSFTAQFAKNQYTVNVAASHSDRGSVTGGGMVDYLDSVTMTATANYGYHFDHWSDTSTDNPHTIVATQNVTLTAYFVPNQYALSVVSSDETRGHVSGGGNYDYLSNRTITAIPNYGYHFTQWNDGVAASTRTVTLTQDTAFSASFAPNQYNLAAVSADETMGTVSGGGTYDYGNTITVTANPVEHYHFLHWNDDNTDNPRTVVIEGDRTLTAFFAIDTHTVSATVNDISRGMVEASGTEFAYGTPCTVTATAYSGYVFSHWSNNVTYNPYTFAVMEDVELTAIFVEEGTQGISDVGSINGFRVYTKDRSIHINGIEEGQYVSIYSVDGRIITTKQNATKQETIPVPSTGVYFIKVGEYPAQKVVVMR